MPKFLVVMTAYNQPSFVTEAATCLRAQTYTDWSCIIVNDGSKDETGEVANAIAASDGRFSVMHIENGGVCRARNIGWKAAPPDADYVHFLDADDTITPESLSLAADYFDAHPDVGSVYGKVLWWCPEKPDESSLWNMERYEKRNHRVVLIPYDDPRVPVKSIVSHPVAPTSVSFFRRTALELVGGWDEELRCQCEDTELQIRCALYSKVNYIDRHVLNWRRHPQNITNDDKDWERGRNKVMNKWRSRVGVDPDLTPTLADAFEFADFAECYLCLLRVKGHLKKREIRLAVKEVLGFPRIVIIYIASRQKLRAKVKALASALSATAK